jgi:putative transposase
MLRAYKHRIYPTKTQAELLNKHFGCCRFIYNLALETRQLNYSGNKINLSCYDLIKQITDLKKDYTWLSEVANVTLQQSIIDLYKAYSNFFKGRQNFPKFKKKQGNQSFRVSLQVKIDISLGKLFIPHFREGINIVFERAPIGTIKSCTISKTPTKKYFVSILVEDGKQLPCKPNIDINNSIGIDLGIKSFITLSDGSKILNPKYLKNDLVRLKILQRRASKKQEYSHNRKKANLAIARKHEKITNRRIDFIHKLTHELVCENQATTICVEDLAVSNLLKNHKLAQAISDVSWSKFIEILSYKCDWHGKNFIKVDRFFASSKTCNKCGWVNSELTLSDREWTCNVCGTTHDRDINAAINIRNSGVGCSGEPVEMSTIVESAKQEKSICPWDPSTYLSVLSF